MKKKHSKEPLPLAFLKKFSEKYAWIWKPLDECCASKGQDLPDWNNACELPIAATASIASAIFPVDPDFPATAACLYAWRKHKEMYTFDRDLADMLMEQADKDLEVPIDILLTLPYPCLWIQYEKSKGVFVWIEHDMNTFELELRILEVDESGVIDNIPVHLISGGTILDAINASLDVSEKELKSKEFSVLKSTIASVQSKKVSKYMQLILYICAENKDEQENAEQKAIYKPSQVPKDAFRELRKWDVGFRVGNTIRKYKSEHKEDSPRIERTGSHVSKRPHTRRGHYHHYWIGSDKDNSRKIILKWVAPMFIGGQGDDVIATEHKVK